MNTPHWMDRHPHHDPRPAPYASTDPTTTNRTADAAHGGHGAHGLMMLICCIPMIVLAVALVATGVAGSGVIVGALLCTAMMAVMMLAMPGSHDHR